MKRGILISSSLGAVIIATAVFMGGVEKKNYYQPRETVMNADGANGAIEWLHMLRANQITGKIDHRDVLRARREVQNLKRKKSSAIDLQWENIGPTNIGGRTRAILFDRSNPSIIYAGAVSGGLFKSTTGGSSWQRVNDFQENLAIVSLCQAANGDIYYGTGEQLYASADGEGNSGFTGGGVFKSTDGGNTFNVLPSTEPVENSSTAEWAAVGKIAADPNNAQRIYAATNRGLRVSDDGGNSWDDAIVNFNSASSDLFVSTGGNVWVKQGASIYKSVNGDPGTYVEMTVSGANPPANEIPRNGGRMRIAVSPQDDNYVYVVSTTVAGFFDKAYQSKDGGETWTVIGTRSSQIDPHGAQGNPQGRYNNALAVSPANKERIFVGGVTFWEWSASNGWLQLGSLGYAPTNPFYIHADNHEVTFHPNNPSVIFVGNDGGVFKSIDNGNTWSWEVRNYVTTQFYKIAEGDGRVMGGTQDNGTILLDPSNALPQSGIRTPGILVGGVTRDGDGGYAEISKLDPDILFKAMQNGVVGRSTDGGTSFSLSFDDEVDPVGNVGNSGFAAFVTPFALWEKLNEPLSEDSIRFGADSAFTSLGFGNGGTDYSGSVSRPQDAAIFIPEGLVIRAGQQEVRSTANGTLTGDGTGTYNPNTGAFSVKFNSGVSLEITAKAAIRYNAGSTVIVESATNEIPITYTLPVALEPTEFLMIQDPVQSMFFVGVTAVHRPTQNNIGGIWMTRRALTTLIGTPEWFHIASLQNNDVPKCMTVSDDGNTLWVGTTNGKLYKISNLNAARDSASTTIDDRFVNGVLQSTSTSVITDTIVRTFGGRAVTSIAVHPNDPDRVIITVGSYGNDNYVLYSNNGTAPMPTFASAQGDLPEMPVYTAVFNYKSSNMDQVIVGTEEGVFMTDDASVSSPSWVSANSGLANVPVFDLIQQKTIRYDLRSPGDYEGALFAGTHGRGIFKSGSTSGPISVKEPVALSNAKKNALKIYPNPAVNKITLNLELDKTADVMITVRDINGKLVKSSSYKNVEREVKELDMDISILSSGTYILTVHAGKNIKSGKLVVAK